MIPSYLNSTCVDRKFEHTCKDPNCTQAVKAAITDRFYITMGHAGFNSRANNRNGYASEKSARFAMVCYLTR